MGFVAGPNPYAYVTGDPVNLSDPSGLCPGCIGEVKVTGSRTGPDYKATFEDLYRGYVAWLGAMQNGLEQVAGAVQNTLLASDSAGCGRAMGAGFAGGGIVGAGVGAAWGATGGSIVPVIGTVAVGGGGAVAGGVVGGPVGASGAWMASASCHGGGGGAAKGTPDRKPTWKTDPGTLQEKMALDAAKRGEGRRILTGLNDPKFKGMEKWELVSRANSGRTTTVHYVRDPTSGQLMDFKLFTTFK